jgi:hypothetical protein
VLAPPAVKFVPLPGQIIGEEGVIVTIGKGFTNTTTVVELTHPLASVPVTEYTVVTIGLAVTLDPVEDDNPLTGDHK